MIEPIVIDPGADPIAPLLTAELQAGRYLVVVSGPNFQRFKPLYETLKKVSPPVEFLIDEIPPPKINESELWPLPKLPPYYRMFEKKRRRA